ncbi:MAG: right-handed parallel beta-helix repeat-containing protein [Candidatus Omnitrophica bacterium]|nr:right-handed parallel beta-helix repeat-containing protein [Candidatus Omnitrophota bacterium]
MNYLKRIGLVMVAILWVGISYADDSNRAMTQVQFSGYGSTNKGERGLFTADFIVPLYYSSDKETLLFFNPKDTYSTPEANEIHQGLGIRHIFNDSFILGFNSFFDRRQADSDNWYSQTGVGFEYLSHPLDARLNWYKPTTKPKVINTTYGFGSTGLIAYDQKEEPLQGLDFEFGVPVFDKYTKTRVYAGGYFYQSRFSKDSNGFRARTETSLTSWLSMDTTFNSKIGNTNEFYGGLRVNLAFDLYNLFGRHGHSFFSAPSHSESARGYLEDRLFDRVVRDIDIQTKTSSNTEGHNTQGLVYVNNTTGSDTGLGTLQSPYKTIVEGVTAAVAGGQWVYVEGLGASNYAGNNTLASGVVLWGSGYNGGFKGLVTSGVYPVINGGTNGIIINNNNTVMGVKIQNASSDGIKFTPGTTLTGTITNNIIINNGYAGIYFESNNGALNNFTITQNTISNNTEDAINLWSNGINGSITNFNISNNTLNNNGYDGIDLARNAGHITNLTITNNTTNSNALMGIDLSYNSGTVSNVTISGNTSNGNGDNGIGMSENSGTRDGFTIINNTTENNGYSCGWCDHDGIDLSYNSGTTSNFTISNNISKSNYDDGLDLAENSGTLTNFTITNNTFTNSTLDEGIGWEDNSGMVSHFTIYNNNLSNNNGAGIYLYNIGTGTINDVTISYNTINNNQSEGIDLDGSTGTITNLNILNNTINGNSGNGLDFDGMTAHVSNLTISSNTINNNTHNAIDLDGNSSPITGLTISNNIMNSNGYDGIDFDGNHNTITNMTISGNTINGNGYDGIDFDGNYSTITNLTISNNTVNSNTLDGIDLAGNHGEMSTVTISGNQTKNNGHNGIDLANNYGLFSGFTLRSNTIIGNARDGIVFSNAAGGSMSSIDLGSQTSRGLNTIDGNDTAGGYYDLYNTSGISNLSAEGNWWGQVGGPLSGKVYGSVDTAAWLYADPN